MRFKNLFLFLLAAMFVGCQEKPATPSGAVADNVPAAAASAGDFGGTLMDKIPGGTIYEVNLRQFTPEGTIDAFMKHLPRLKELGVDVLWFMPMHPISVEKRKQGGLGSYYAVADYKEINPEFGDKADFDQMVKAIHDLGMYIIIDWVPNHTGWDHPWIKAHPEWYTKDEDGNIIDPIDPETGKSWGWTDVADLNYDNAELRQEMINDMAYWVREHGIDGFRVDVAHSVPNDWHKDMIAQLRKIKPVIMLAESDKPENINTAGYDMDYGWPFHHLLNAIAQGKAHASEIEPFFDDYDKKFSRGYHMNFITNHDENTWNGTVFERMGDAHKVMAVLTFTVEGVPLIYAGQEAGMKKRLRFFEKDTIDFSNIVYEDFYKKLTTLKAENEALWTGKAGGPMVIIPTNNTEDVFAFTRKKNGDQVVVIANLSKSPQEVTLKGEDYIGTFNNVFGNGTMALQKDMKIKLNGWDYLILEKH